MFRGLALWLPVVTRIAYDMIVQQIIERFNVTHWHASLMVGDGGNAAFAMEFWKPPKSDHQSRVKNF
jgi:hypothetical protein